MTEELLDALRPLAHVIDEEGARLKRALKGSSAVEDLVREHLGNCLKACQSADALLNVRVQFTETIASARTVVSYDIGAAPLPDKSWPPMPQTVPPPPNPPPAAEQPQTRKGRK